MRRACSVENRSMKATGTEAFRFRAGAVDNARQGKHGDDERTAAE